MTLQLPTLLALLGAALLAVALFAPKSVRTTGVSVPAPLASAVDRWVPPLEDAPGSQAVHAPSADEPAPAWPGRFDPRAAGCDAAARVELIGALAELRTGWAESVLRSAFDEESDPHVRRALEDVTVRRSGADSVA